MDEEKEIEKNITDANDVVSPRNTELLYGSKADQPDPLETAGKAETVETSLPEDFRGVDQEIGVNEFPSHSARNPQDLSDEA